MIWCVLGAVVGLMNTMDSERFYRQLFLRRYALLLEKAEQVFRLSPDTMAELRKKILNLDWIDSGLEKLDAHLNKSLKFPPLS